MSKPIIGEIVWLRTIACISVVFGHTLLSASNVFYGDADPFGKNIIYLLLLASYFGTPAFIFMSEFLIAKNYSNHIPSGFVKKRAKFLLLPYLFMSIVYGFVNAESFTFNAIFTKTLRSIFLAESTVYFIIIIFQFYILHKLLYKKLNKWNPKTVLLTTFMINVLYLSFFHFTSTPENEVASYIWRRGHWLLFIAWLFYFSLGYYASKYFETLKTKLNSSMIFWKLLTLSMALFFIIVFNKYFNIISTVSSKRIDMILYTACIILLIFSLANFIKKTPNFMIIFSNYSFSIYLIHKIFLSFFESFNFVSEMNIILYIVLALTLSIIGSMAVSYLFNLFKIGKLFVGQNKQLKISRSSVNKNVKMG